VNEIARFGFKICHRGDFDGDLRANW
jgi:hypothetical protein